MINDIIMRKRSFKKSLKKLPTIREYSPLRQTSLHASTEAASPLRRSRAASPLRIRIVSTNEPPPDLFDQFRLEEDSELCTCSVQFGGKATRSAVSRRKRRSKRRYSRKR